MSFNVAGREARLPTILKTMMRGSKTDWRVESTGALRDFSYPCHLPGTGRMGAGGGRFGNRSVKRSFRSLISLLCSRGLRA